MQYRSEAAGDEPSEEKEAEKGDFQGAVEKNKEGEVIWREGKLKAGFERPVVVHRAILGSVERMSAILMEHFGGKWPFWLSPRQVMIVPVAASFNDYAEWLVRQFALFGFFAEADVTGNTLNKKVRNAQMAQWNYICVVGDKEKSDLAVNVRQRDVEKPIGTFHLKQFMMKLQEESLPSSQPINKFEAFEGREIEVDAPVSSVPLPVSAAPPPASAPPKSGKVTAKGDEAVLQDQPYIKGFAPTKADAELFNKLKETEIPQTSNLKRWFEHIESFAPAERAAWPSA